MWMCLLHTYKYAFLYWGNNNGLLYSTPPHPEAPAPSMGGNAAYTTKLTFCIYLFLLSTFFLLSLYFAATIKWEEKLHNNPFEIVGLSLNICVNIVTNAQPPLSNCQAVPKPPHQQTPVPSNGWMMSNRRSPLQSTMSNFVAWLATDWLTRMQSSRQGAGEREGKQCDAYACNNGSANRGGRRRLTVQSRTPPHTHTHWQDYGIV